MKKNNKYIIIANIIGIFLGKYTFNQYNKEKNMIIKEVNNEVYLVQTEVYKEENIMNESSKHLKYYLYYKDKDGYHVFIGISKYKNNIKK